MPVFNSKPVSLSLLASLIGVSTLALVNPEATHAFTIGPVVNSDFNASTTLDGTNGWTGLGSAAISNDHTGVSFDNSNQGIVTTACPSSGTFCGSRDDDPDSTTANTFNLGGQDQISASPEVSNNLQEQLNLSDNILSIPTNFEGSPLLDSEGQVINRVPKEGSAIFQDITITDEPGDNGDVNTRISFNWDFLTNDGASSLLGDTDFGFFSISDGMGFEELIVLESSTGAIPGADGDNYGASVPVGGLYTDSFFSQEFDLAPGTYRIGFGVVDIENSDRSSALLFDNLSVQEVPFEFSPTTGIGLVLGFWGLKKTRDRFKS